MQNLHHLHAVTVNDAGAITDMIARQPIAPLGFAIEYTAAKGGALYTTRNLTIGQTVLRFQGTVLPIEECTPLALQVDDRIFLQTDPTSPFQHDNFLNHSCRPNCRTRFLNINHVYLEALRDIKAGEELTFDYNTTEWDLLEQERYMKQPCIFHCSCGAQECMEVVLGFRFLPIRRKLSLQSQLSPFLSAKLKEELDELGVLLFEPKGESVEDVI